MKHNIIEPLQPLAVAIDQPKLDVANARTGHALDKIALSLDQYGQRKPIVVNRRTGLTEAGNGTLTSARQLGWSHIAVVYVDDDPNTATGYALADNRLTDISRFDDRALLAALQSLDTAAEVPGFSQDDMADLLKKAEQDFEATVPQMVTFDSDDDTQAALKALQDAYGVDDVGEVVKRAVKAAQVQAEADAPPDVPPSQEVVEDEPPVDKAEELQDKWQVRAGDVWTLGEHRVICGDCTDEAVVARLMGGEVADLICADPPYGMGKEKDGIANDNLYREKLDAFQMKWWHACRRWVTDNASAYIWGNAEDLWRLWYVGGLKDSERLTFRSEVVWSKGDAGAGGISHQGAEGLRLYPNSTERCIFFMLGEQGFNNNADNYWEGWEPIRAYLKGELAKVGDIKWAKRTAGHSETSGCHWFDASQWTMPTEQVYKAWQTAANGQAFKREYDDLKREFYATRAYFDNTHDNMTDVWQFGRVTGDERWEHATPKPVAMIGRIVKSSSPSGVIVYDPFLGSGTTLIACEQLNRKCYGLEIEPKYVAVILERWSTLTGNEPVKEAR